MRSSFSFRVFRHGGGKIIGGREQILVRRQLAIPHGGGGQRRVFKNPDAQRGKDRVGRRAIVQEILGVLDVLPRFGGAAKQHEMRERQAGVMRRLQRDPRFRPGQRACPAPRTFCRWPHPGRIPRLRSPPPPWPAPVRRQSPPDCKKPTSGRAVCGGPVPGKRRAHVARGSLKTLSTKKKWRSLGMRRGGFNLLAPPPPAGAAGSAGLPAWDKCSRCI